MITEKKTNKYIHGIMHNKIKQNYCGKVCIYIVHNEIYNAS